MGPQTEGALALKTADQAVTREQRRSRRKREVRARTISVKRMTKRELELGRLLYPDVEDVIKPKTRVECASGERPCPFVSCKHHLYLDVSAKTGAIKLNFPDLEVWEMNETCALDVADRGGTTLEEVGAIMNLTRERIRQVEVKGLAKLQALGDMMALRDYVDEGPVGKRRLPVLAKEVVKDEEDDDVDVDEEDDENEVAQGRSSTSRSSSPPTSTPSKPNEDAQLTAGGRGNTPRAMAIRTALLSVSEKTGLVDFARALHDSGAKILSSGGTANALREAGVPVETVESYTGSPEVMGGRVKTLHPRVHGGILSRGEMDTADLARIGGREIDLVCVNLYPFEKTAADPKSSHEHIVENIDIGGPSMIRSAAKNHARVTVVCDPEDYGRVIEALGQEGDVPAEVRAELAAKAFAHTAAYDAAISAYLSARNPDGSRALFPQYLTLPFERAYGLRYGENPHQQGAFYVARGAREGSLARAESLGAGGKELPFNNLVDVDAALDAVREFDRPAAVVVKHTNPCGVAVA